MPRFTKQKVFCNICGKQFETSFGIYEGKVCSFDCFDELKRLKILSMLGKEYYPDPEKKGTDDVG